jgi:hypothetical protein
VPARENTAVAHLLDNGRTVTALRENPVTWKRVKVKLLLVA